MEPAPDRRGGRRAEAALDDQPVQLSAREARKRQPLRRRQLADERLHLGHLLRGENGAGGPRAHDPRARPAAPRRSASASGRLLVAPFPTGARSQCCSHPRRHTGSSSPAPPPCAATSNTRPGAPTRPAPHRSKQSRTRSSWPQRQHSTPPPRSLHRLRTELADGCTSARPSSPTSSRVERANPTGRPPGFPLDPRRNRPVRVLF